MVNAVDRAFPLRPETSALIVVDMQNDFVRVGAPMEVPDARATIGAHKQLLELWREERSPVIYTRFIAGPRPTLMWNWSPQLEPPVCSCWPGFHRFYADVQRDLDCADVIDELHPHPEDAIID